MFGFVVTQLTHFLTRFQARDYMDFLSSPRYKPDVLCPIATTCSWIFQIYRKMCSQRNQKCTKSEAHPKKGHGIRTTRLHLRMSLSFHAHTALYPSDSPPSPCLSHISSPLQHLLVKVRLASFPSMSGNTWNKQTNRSPVTLINQVDSY